MRLLAATLVLATAAAGCGPGGEEHRSGSRSAAIEDSVAGFLAAWAEGTQEGGWDRLVDRYADDPSFRWVEDGRVRYRSIEELRAGFDDVRATFSDARTEFVEPSIAPLAPGLAHVVTRFRTTLTREDGSEVRFGGAMTMTVRHTEGGWKVLRGHMSSERPRSRGGGG
jgi:ketosteroid isomerase-like protein